jgi:excisionase family DNA binding protein
MQKTILSTADVARLFRVTDTTVKRWADRGTLRCQKTPGGHRKFEIRNVVDFAEKNNFDPSGALETAGGGKVHASVRVALISRDYDVLAKEYIRRALSQDRTDLHGYLSYLYEHRIPLWGMDDRVLRPAMYGIGEMWARGELGVNDEHRASYRTLDALSALQLQILMKPPSGESALLACPGEELHDIGLRSIGYLLESEGWSVHYLGARTPLLAILSAISKLRPSVVCLSVTETEHAASLPGVFRRVASAARASGAYTVAGGQAAGAHLLRPDLCDEILGSAEEMLHFIRRFEGRDSGQGPEAPRNQLRKEG